MHSLRQHALQHHARWLVTAAGWLISRLAMAATAHHEQRTSDCHIVFDPHADAGKGAERLVVWNVQARLNGQYHACGQEYTRTI